jgi:hypothetical protein
MTRTVRDDAPMDTPDPLPLDTWIPQTGAGVWRRNARQASDRNILEGFSASALANGGALNITRADRANTAAPSRSCGAVPLLDLAALRKAHRSRNYRRGSSRESSPYGHHFAVATLSRRPTPVGELLRRCSISSVSVCYGGTCLARTGATKWQSLVRRKREGHICGVAQRAEPSPAFVTGLPP